MGANCGKHLCKGKHDCGSCNTATAKWIAREVKYDDETIIRFSCSNCAFNSGFMFKYCPNCGAKME